MVMGVHMASKTKQQGIITSLMTDDMHVPSVSVSLCPRLDPTNN